MRLHGALHVHVVRLTSAQHQFWSRTYHAGHQFLRSLKLEDVLGKALGFCDPSHVHPDQRCILWCVWREAARLVSLYSLYLFIENIHSHASININTLYLSWSVFGVSPV